ncbi:universal stress protein [Stackebrandtia soli]|uniref:universal stress protein n=1 Tax=Stackebrandtia soli TaxID=1892856 RepID=UPI0039E92BB7
MSGLDRIVVGIADGSESMAALTWAVTEAARAKARLTLVHAFQWMVPAYMVDSPRFAALDAVESERLSRDSATEAAQELLERAMEVVLHRDRDAVVDIVAAEGHPVTVLREEAMNVDLLVVGSRGRGLLGRVLLGSVSSGIAGVPTCPVVVVRALHRQHDDNPPIVVGVDGSRASDAALRFAFESARRDSAFLRVLHGRRHNRRLGADRETTDAEEERRWLAEMVEPLASEYDDVTYTVDTVDGKAALALTDASAHARLVVVGTRGDKHLPSLRLGSVSQGVLHHAWCPVAIVPAPQTDD